MRPLPEARAIERTPGRTQDVRPPSPFPTEAWRKTISPLKKEVSPSATDARASSYAHLRCGATRRSQDAPPGSPKAGWRGLRNGTTASRSGGRGSF